MNGALNGSTVQIATMIAGLLAARCADADETVRRASLQQLTSLRIPSLVDVMLPPIEKLLDDPSPAVRAAAVLAVLKVATLADKDHLDLSRFWTRVDAMLRADESAEVLHACVALKLQREDEATMAKDKALIEDLMLRLPVRTKHLCCYRSADLHLPFSSVQTVLCRSEHHGCAAECLAGTSVQMCIHCLLHAARRPREPNAARTTCRKSSTAGSGAVRL